MNFEQFLKNKKSPNSSKKIPIIFETKYFFFSNLLIYTWVEVRFLNQNDTDFNKRKEVKHFNTFLFFIFFIIFYLFFYFLFSFFFGKNIESEIIILQLKTNLNIPFFNFQNENKIFDEKIHLILNETLFENFKKLYKMLF